MSNDKNTSQEKMETSMAKTAMNDFWHGFEKQAKIKLKDVENQLGFYIAPEHVAETNEMINRLNEERLGLKHPWLTGIPTLGLWPAISHSNAAEEVADHLMRTNPSYIEAIKKDEEIAHQRRKETLQAEIADREARAKERMVSTATLGAVQGLGMYLGRKGREEDE